MSASKLFSRSELAALAPLSSAQYTEVASGVYVMRAFGVAEAAAIVGQAALSEPWLAAGINAGLEVDPAVRDAEVLYEELHQRHAQLYRDRLEAITEPLVGAVAANSRLTEVQLVRYHAGGKYIDHRDSPAPEATTRRLSLVCYLNETFTGGELTFPELDITFVPTSGILVAFTPTHLHRAEAVRTGTKYAITAWYHAVTSG